MTENMLRPGVGCAKALSARGMVFLASMLMVSYAVVGTAGCSPSEDDDRQTDTPLAEDGDGDGFSEVEGDCNDSDATVYPGAEELCDAVDNDCDGAVDEGAVVGTVSLGTMGGFDMWRPGRRLSAMSFALSGLLGSPLLTGAGTCGSADQDGDSWSTEQGDCDDSNASIHPGASESCDGLDNDCDGTIDDGAPPTDNSPTWYLDTDRDGYGTDAQTVIACLQPAGYAEDDADCNDADAAIHPGAPEQGNGIDDDCDGKVDESWVALAAGAGHSLALENDGSVWAWGSNGSGQLGDGTYTSRLTPVPVTGITDVLSISAGYGFSLALRADRTIWGWGSNRYYQLGAGQPGYTPSPINDLRDVVAIAAGHNFGLAVTADGAAWAWGGNYLPAPTTDPHRWQGTGTVKFVAVAGGVQCALALASDGSVWAWENESGTVPYQVASLEGMVDIAAGGYFSLALDGSGTVWGWGSNAFGQLGDGSTEDRDEPAPVPDLNQVEDVSAGEYHSMALQADGTILTWGSNADGELGNGSTDDRAVPMTVPGVPEMTKISVGAYHSLAASQAGEVWAWGANGAGELGTGTTFDLAIPALAEALDDIGVQVEAGYYHAMSISEDGELYTWGGNLGVESDGLTYVPGILQSVGEVISISAGDYFSLAVNTEGVTRAWGDNDYGQLGDGTTTSSATPVQVLGLPAASEVAAGDFHSVALDGSGHVWAWGWNSNGQLGSSTLESSTIPVEVKGIDRVVDIDSGGRFVLALRDDRTVWAWGSNAAGQLGNGTGEDSSVPVRVPGLSGIVAMTAGYAHALALGSDGTVWAWGYNDRGQLGVGSGEYDKPTRVTDVCPALAVAAGEKHSLALCNDGRVMSWGHNTYGELGDGSYYDSDYPVAMQLPEGAVSISASAYVSFAATSGGKVYGSGDNSAGLLAMNPGWTPQTSRFP